MTRATVTRARLAAVMALGAAALAPRSAAADDVKVACVEASDKAQSLRDAHKLLQAREALLVCAKDACPGPVRKQCGEWLTAVEKATPTLVLAARRGDRDVRAVVELDGKRLADALDGTAVPMDPGRHTLRFTAAGFEPAEQEVVVREGEKGRPITVELTPSSGSVGPVAAEAVPPASPAPPPGGGGFHVPVAGWILGGATVVAAGSFAILGVTGKSDLDKLRTTCGATASCAQGDVDAAHTKLLVADVSLYVGIAALAGGVVVTILANRHASSPPSALAEPLTLRF